MHTNRNAQPKKEIRKGIYDTKDPYRKKSGKAYKDTQERVNKEWTHTYKKRSIEIVDLFVHHIASWITKLKEADLQHSNTT